MVGQCILAIVVKRREVRNEGIRKDGGENKIRIFRFKKMQGFVKYC